MVAQLDRVAGATDPGPGRLIRRAAVEIVVEGGGHLRRRRGVPAGDGAAGTVAGYLSCRDRPQRPGRRRCPPVPGSQTGSQRRQASGHIRRRPAMVGAARLPVRPRPATSGDVADAPEKRKVGTVCHRGAEIGTAAHGTPPRGLAWAASSSLGRESAGELLAKSACPPGIEAAGDRHRLDCCHYGCMQKRDAGGQSH